MRVWRWVGCGCAVVVVVGGLAAIAALNWQKVTEVYQQAKTTVSELMHVSNVLQTRYGGHVAVTVRHQSGVEGSILRVTLSNPAFLDHLDPDGPAAKQKALEVAATTRDALEPRSRYDNYEIAFSRESGTTVNVARSWVFSFRADELPAAKESK